MFLMIRGNNQDPFIYIVIQKHCRIYRNGAENAESCHDRILRFRIKILNFKINIKPDKLHFCGQLLPDLPLSAVPHDI